MKRKIAAILAADIAGYSRLVAEDEEETLRRRNSYFSVFEDFIAKVSGRIFNTAGDAVLAEFPSAVDAVRCAIDIQESLRTRNLAYPPSRQMSFRIGITVGDVVEREGDLLGDGVNIAARLQTLAEPGGICVSRSVYEQVSNKLSVRFADIGEKHVKNIPTPIHVYAVEVSAAHEHTSARRKPRSSRALAIAVVITAIVLGAVGGIYYVSPNLILSFTGTAPVREPASLNEDIARAGAAEKSEPIPAPVRSSTNLPAASESNKDKGRQSGPDEPIPLPAPVRRSANASATPQPNGDKARESTSEPRIPLPAPITTTVAKPKDNSWDGIWNGKWAGVLPASITIKDGQVFQYVFEDIARPITNQSMSRDTVRFGNDFIAFTMTRVSPTRSTVQYADRTGRTGSATFEMTVSAQTKSAAVPPAMMQFDEDKTRATAPEQPVTLPAPLHTTASPPATLPFNEDKVRKIASDQSLPLPAPIQVLAPSSTVPKKFVEYLGAWGGDQRWNGVGRQMMLVVTSISDAGEASGIYSVGPPTTRSVNQRLPVFWQFSGKISDSLKFESPGGAWKYEFKVRPDGTMQGKSANRNTRIPDGAITIERIE